MIINLKWKQTAKTRRESKPEELSHKALTIIINWIYIRLALIGRFKYNCVINML
jgi:hypothetical protein